MFCEVIPIRLFREDGGVLTYSFDASTPVKIGQIVEIPLGKSKTYGIVTKIVKNVDFKTRDILKILYDEPLPPHIIKAIFWLSEYYLVPLPLSAKLFLPQGLGKNRRQKTTTNAHLTPIKIADIPLNTAQNRALKELRTTESATKLLHGITGSGKTNIYLSLAKEAYSAKKSTILLVPEIALTSQLVQVFEKTFGKCVTLIHSNLTEAERHLIWENILKSEHPQIVIGPRSALLSPVKDLGLIIIDEAHESTYFQENTPKYSALRLASFIANTEKISCIYGTATPLISDYYLANQKSAVVTLSEKAKTDAKPPKFHLISLKNRENFIKNRYFSDQLLAAIEENLKSGHQTLIFHNRRGSAPLTLCEECGWQALCPNCFLPLTLHSDTYTLMCHTCGHTCPVPKSCPDCKTPGIIHKGFGTKLLEQELRKLFKDASVIRFDADNAKSDTLAENFDKVKNGEFNIIIGTQTVAKGLDLPLLKTVGVVQADAGLSLPDFSAPEKTYELLNQVIGRVGRGHLDATDVFIQTYQPENPVITSAIHSDYQAFYKATLGARKKGHFPPFYYLAKLSVTYKTEAATVKNITALYRSLSGTSLEITKPTPAFHERTTRGYTWQIFLRSTSRTKLLSTLRSLQSSTKNSGNLHLTIDPPSLL